VRSERLVLPHRLEEIDMTALDQLPVVVIGAGPTGLAAAAHLTARGMSYLVLEATDSVAACFRSTAHVRLFSPWKMNVDSAAARVLERHGWRAPDPEAMPTAGEMRSHYLEPLARALASHIRYGTRVQDASRRGFDKVKSGARELAPFVLRVRTREGEEQIEARAVIDATGTWSTPNWMGGNGLPALGEEAAASQIQYGMPDVLGSARARYGGKRVLVVGSGHSAVGSLIALSELAILQAQTSIVWAIRSDNLEKIFGGGAKDGLPERGNLGATLRQLIDTRKLELVPSFRIEAVRRKLDQLEVSGTDKNGVQRSVAGVDEIIVATGTRPDLSLARELRLKLDAWLESTEQLAPLIDPNLHSCGSVPPHGHRELAHPEPGYYAIGAKSYGRAPNFLLATGYEQARSVVAALAGDMAAADQVQLVLPETGVCVTDFAAPVGAGCCPAPSKPAAAGGCCPPATKPVVKSGCG
jgi:cation diffusion facilitator CzcD-associated flavoprotein CzcO